MISMLTRRDQAFGTDSIQRQIVAIGGRQVVRYNSNGTPDTTFLNRAGNGLRLGEHYTK